jgi:hypothetical protein
MKMSGFEPLENLLSAKATRPLLLLSILLFSAGPGLAAGLAPTTAGMLGNKFTNGNARLYNQYLKDPAPTINHGIDELTKQYFKDPAPTKGTHIDPELQSQGKDQDSFTHEETVQHGYPPNSNNNNNNGYDDCESSSDDRACKNRTLFQAPGNWDVSGRINPSTSKKLRSFGDAE